MIKLENVTLPDDLEWTDEHSWRPVEQVVTPTLTGAIVIEEAHRQAGRPITLASNGGAWITRATLLALEALAATPGGDNLTLQLHGRTFTVRFRYTDGPAVEGTQVYRLANPPADHPYLVTIRLMEVE